MRTPIALVFSDADTLPIAELSRFIAEDAPTAAALQAWALSDGPLLSATTALTPGSAEGHYRQALELLAQRPEQALAVSVRLPFCAARCLCCERHVHIAQPASVLDAYVSALVDEVDAVARAGGGGRDVLQLHLGGGTANELSESQLARLVTGLQRHWRLPADAEISAECDPRRVGEFQLRVLRGLGFRRLTFGVLDLDPAVQRAIGRQQSVALVDDVCDLARQCGVDYVNLDLMIGLPHQTPTSWRTTLQRVLAMAPDRLTLSRYRHRPLLAPAQRALDRQAMPTAEECDALAEIAVDLLCGAGYRWIGADHFVLDNDELAQALESSQLRRSLISYTAAAATPVLAFGAGAVGEIDGSLFWNEASLSAWCMALHGGRLPVAQARLGDHREMQRRAAVEHLLCRQELPAAHVQGGLETAYRQLARHEADGLVRVLDDRIVVTPRGRHALPALCGVLGAPVPVAQAEASLWMC